ncbi:neopullulanase [Lachnospiraceae bacterium KM106-2]|nr:neopullulanase [Lachnospiraceae bacterium KM106-2]
MNFSAVYHRTTDNYCYPLNESELIVNLKTGYDVERVFICYGDPFSAGILGGNEQWVPQREEIPYKKKLKHQIWWTTTLKPEFKRCRYYFELQTANEKWFYFEDGFLTEKGLHLEGKMLQCFTFPWMNSADINRTPRWVNDTVWYQIFPERFCNGDDSLSPEWVKPWKKGKVRNEDFYGGDLVGITKKLDYLKDLGITGLYLTPINESESSHKYDTTDYRKIDPYFGDEKIFKHLVEESHDHGMKIMLDGVFNHCGRKFAPWMDVVEKGPESKYYDWFMIHEWPFRKDGKAAKSGQYYTFAFIDNMPKLNTNNPAVIEYFVSVCEEWVQKYDVDGIRLDVANEVSHEFCKELRKRLKAIKPDIYILGEIWHDSSNWLLGDQFDAVMNYPLAGTISDFWINQELTNHDFECGINRCYTMYMQQVNDVLFNLLDSHDTNRLIDKVKSLDVFYQQLAVLYTMPGSPCIYYGTEIALEGGFDPDCRRCMPWDEIDSGKYDDRLGVVKRLIELRKTNSLFRSRNFHFPNTINNQRVIEYIKIGEYGDSQMAVYLNCSNEDIELQGFIDPIFSLKYDKTKKVLKPYGILISKQV